MAAHELRDEARIVWLRPLEALPRYVREAAHLIPRRVGISEWCKSARSGAARRT